MPNLTALKGEIDSDLLGRGYGTMTNAEIANDLNTPYRPAGTKAVSLADTEIAIRQADKWVAFNQRKDAREADGSISNPTVFQIMSVFDGQIEEVNWRDGGYWEGLLDQAQTDGELGAGVVAGWKALSDAFQTRANELRLGPVNGVAVANAKALP